MKCKICGAPLNGDEDFCYACGAPVNREEEAVVAQEKPEEGVADGNSDAQAVENDEKEEHAEMEANNAASTDEKDSVSDELPLQSDKKSSGKGPVLAIAAIVVLAAIIVALVVLLFQNRETDEIPTADQNVTEEETPEEEAIEEELPEDELEEQDETAEEDAATEEEEPAFVPSVSYIKEADEFDDELLQQVIATCGDSTLTNEKLAYYYWREFYAFVNTYSTYVTMLMDPSARLDTQAYKEDQSWDQFFMETAVKTYQTCAAAANEARKEGYTLSEDDQKYLDDLAESIGALAEQYGYASADEYLAMSFGPYCTMESYQEFMDEYILGASYLNAKLSEREITDEELDAYYEENQESYTEKGLEKDDTHMVNVRHILIQPEAVDLQEGDEGYEEAVQAAKDEAKAKAEEIYQQWQDGDKTEDSFGALAMENSADGSAASGGLIEEIVPGKTVEAFDAWCFDESRKPGDTDIVETEYGYHIIFYVGQCDESYWHKVVYSDYQNVCYQKICEDIRALYPGEENLTNAAVYPSNTGV